MEMKIFLTNLGKYNEGELVGKGHWKMKIDNLLKQYDVSEVEAVKAFVELTGGSIAVGVKLLEAGCLSFYWDYTLLEVAEEFLDNIDAESLEAESFDYFLESLKADYKQASNGVLCIEPYWEI